MRVVPKRTRADASDLLARGYGIKVSKMGLALRLFGSSQPKDVHRRFSYTPHCCTYQLSSRLVTHYVHYYDDQRFDIRYRIGHTDTYINLPRSVISTVVSGNQGSQTLYENVITRYSPILRPTTFHRRSEKEPSRERLATSMRAIGAYIPVESRSYLEELVSMKDILVRVVPSRKTKCGDHRRSACGEHLITVNETDNHLGFMLTLLHELAHAFAPRAAESTPHDTYWKLMFANFLVDCVGFFPAELTAYLTLLACNPPSRKDICEEHMIRNCLAHGFKEQSFARIDLLRTKLKLEQLFGVKLKPFDF